MIRILTDSVAGISAEIAAEHGIDVISLYINDGTTEYVDAEMDYEAFFEKLPTMIDDLPHSSQPSQLQFEEYFEQAAACGDEVLGLFISSGLSGTYDGALRAARAVKARNLNFKFALVDTMSAGYDEAYCVFAACQAAKQGKSLEECAQVAADCVAKSRIIFATESLTYLHKGGRIHGMAALLGNMIQLTPIITVVDGIPKDIAKVRTQKKALAAMFKQLQKDAETGGLLDLVVQYMGPREPAQKWAQEVIEPFVGHAVKVVPVSPVISLHVGPAIGLAYTCERPIDPKLATVAPANLVAMA